MPAGPARGGTFTGLRDPPGGAFESTAWDVSAGGRALAGTGIDPRGQREGWVAVLPE